MVGRYKLVRRLAAGGMGEVYLAAQGGPAGFEKVVALKRMLPTLASERELVKLFLDEARLVARLSHRNICQIYELGEDGDGYFVAMEFVQGTSVRGLIDRLEERGERIPPAMAIDVAAQVAEALAYASDAPGRDGKPLRIVHRDVTPQNILLSTSGDVKLIDFGVAKSTDQSHATQSGTVKGKLAYMSPEQSRGKGVIDGRSDLFSLGIVLYEMLTGTNPFAHPDMIQTVLAIQGGEYPPLASVDPALAPADPVLARLLAKEAEARPVDANEAFEELSALRPQFPRPARRLGPLVTEHFASEISGVIKSVTDSDVRRALRQEIPSTPAHGAPAVQPVAIEPTVRRQSGLQDAPTEVGKALGDAQTRIGPRAEPAVPAVPASSGRSKGPAIALVAVVLLAGGAFAFKLLPGEAPPVARDPVPLRVPRPPLVAEPEPRVAEPTPPEPQVAEPVPPVEPVQPEPQVAAPVEPEPEPVVPDKPVVPGRKVPPRIKKSPGTKVAVVVPPPVEPVKPVEPPEVVTPPPPPPVVALGTVSASGPFGKAKVTLTDSSGHVTLRKVQELVIGLDYSIVGGALSAKITSEPWAIVSIDGVSKGKTPIALPALGRTPLPIELRRMGGSPVSLVLTAEVAK